MKHLRNPDEVQQSVQKLYCEHQQEWPGAILDPAPDGTFLRTLHLRMIELENMKAAIEELR